jgi:Cu/Ag efflux protein CusF
MKTRLGFVSYFALSLYRLSLCGLTLCTVPAFCQDATAGRALGVVTKIDADARQITLKTDAGAEVSVSLEAKATFRRVAPGETSMANAATIALTDIHTGDRVLARGKSAEDQKSIAATIIVVMSQGDIASKQAAERADWDRRGATGIVAAVTADSVTINVRTLQGVTPMLITPAPNAVVRRYAPDSVKFADAKPSTLADIKKGDQVRARGAKTPDNSTMAAEEIVSWRFQMIAGLVISVDPQENIVRINNIETKKQMTVKIIADSSVKKLAPQISLAIANRLHGVTDAAAGGRGPGAVVVGAAPISGAPAGGPPAGEGRGGLGGGRGGFGGGRGAGDLQSMIDRTPAITVADLKTGDAIIVSSTVGASADQVTAITLLAGVEAILTKPGTREMSLGDWNVGGGDLGGIGQ